MRLVRFVRTSETAKRPRRSSGGAAGYDLYADSDATVPPGGSALVSAGISMDTSGYAGILTHRSSVNKKGICIYGLIDPDYRGTIYIPVVNAGNEPFVIKVGDRIAQIRFVELPEINIKEVEALDGTKRGSGGFGSTGS